MATDFVLSYPSLGYQYNEPPSLSVLYKAPDSSHSHSEEHHDSNHDNSEGNLDTLHDVPEISANIEEQTDTHSQVDATELTSTDVELEPAELSQDIVLPHEGDKGEHQADEVLHGKDVLHDGNGDSSILETPTNEVSIDSAAPTDDGNEIIVDSELVHNTAIESDVSSHNEAEETGNEARSFFIFSFSFYSFFLNTLISGKNYFCKSKT